MITAIIRIFAFFICAMVVISGASQRSFAFGDEDINTVGHASDTCASNWEIKNFVGFMGADAYQTAFMRVSVKDPNNPNNVYVSGGSYWFDNIGNSGSDAPLPAQQITVGVLNTCYFIAHYKSKRW